MSVQVSRTLLSILADVHNNVVMMISTCPLLSLSPIINHFVTVPMAPTIGITVRFMFHDFSVPLHGLVTYFLFTFFQFHSVIS